MTLAALNAARWADANEPSEPERARILREIAELQERRRTHPQEFEVNTQPPHKGRYAKARARDDAAVSA